MQTKTKVVTANCILLIVNILLMMATLSFFLQGHGFFGETFYKETWEISSILWLMLTILLAGGVTYNAFQIKYAGESKIGLFILNVFVVISSFTSIGMLLAWWNFGTPSEGIGGAPESFINYAILPLLLLLIPISVAAPVGIRHMKEAREMEKAGKQQRKLGSVTPQ